MIDKTVHMSMLFDFYGQLLTDKQRLFFSLYHQDDLSLGEIAEQFDVTRQAVYDTVRRSQQSLVDFEEKLRLVHRYARQRRLLEKIQAGFQDLNETLSCESANGPWEAQLAELDKLMGQLIENFYI